MPIEMYKDAILTVDVPEHGLRAGDVGTVVERHVATDGSEGFSLEFFDMTGSTVAVVTVPTDAVRAPSAGDLPTVRARAGRIG